jgi:hypothetical protein
MDDSPQDRGAAKPTKLVQKILLGALALFLLFGDRALREIWHFSFFASPMIYGGVLLAFLVGSLIWVYFRDG